MTQHPRRSGAAERDDQRDDRGVKLSAFSRQRSTGWSARRLRRYCVQDRAGSKLPVDPCDLSGLRERTSSVSVGSQVGDAIRKLAQGRFEDAVVHMGVALSATARLEYPEDGNKRACRKFLERNLSIISKIGWVSFGVSQPMSFRYRRLHGRPPTVGVRTMPEMLYDVVRCTAIHEAGLPNNLHFTALPVIQTGPDGELVLPIDVIYGLLIAVVASPKNADEEAEGDPPFSFGGKRIRLNDLWGKRDKVAAFIGIE